MIFHESHLPADNSHEISCLISYICKSSKIGNCRLLQIIGGALWVSFCLPDFLSIDRYMHENELHILYHEK